LIVWIKSRSNKWFSIKWHSIKCYLVSFTSNFTFCVNIVDFRSNGFWWSGHLIKVRHSIKLTFDQMDFQSCGRFDNVDFRSCCRSPWETGLIIIPCSQKVDCSMSHLNKILRINLSYAQQSFIRGKAKPFCSYTVANHNDN
jgi:hypothetical protein